MPTRVTQCIALTACGVLIYLASLLIPRINDGRLSLNMYGSANVAETAPPEYAFLVQAFGSFRGLITNMVFIRAEDAKRAGRYYDAMQLASWICKLQPRFPSVWEFQSWNMAWNISVTTYTTQERWNWVYNGAKLIRDEGLKYNPRAINLYRQLAWVFVNKMSETIDEYHMTYKREWAYRMHLLLGPPPDLLGDYLPGDKIDSADKELSDDPLAVVSRKAGRDRVETMVGEPSEIHFAEIERFEIDESRSLEYNVAKKSVHDWLLNIAEAPKTLDDLYESNPATRELVARLRQIGVTISDDLLAEDDYWRDEGLAFTFFRPYRRLSDPIALLNELRDETPEEDADAMKLRNFDEIVHVAEKRPEVLELVRFLQRKTLIETYKLDPKQMIVLVDLFGPLDWRCVDAHSLYWISEGLIAGGETIGKFGNDKVNASRLIFFSLHNLYLRNRLVFEPNYEETDRSYLNLNMDLNFIESMHQAFLKYGRMIDPAPGSEGVGSTYRSGHQNFLTEAIVTLYHADRKNEARHYFEYLRNNYGRTDRDKMNPAFAKSLAQFVSDYLRENITGSSERRSAITASLSVAFKELANGNLARYNALLAKALDMHSDYNKDKMEASTGKLRLPPFNEYMADVLRRLLERPALSQEVLLEKARLWRVLELPLRQAVYDNVIGQLTKECSLAKFNPSKAFPAPEGLDEYRRRSPAPGPPETDEDDVETPAQRLG